MSGFAPLNAFWEIGNQKDAANTIESSTIKSGLGEYKQWQNEKPFFLFGFWPGHCFYYRWHSHIDDDDDDDDEHTTRRQVLERVK